jgi:hypothetical protein
MRAASLAVLALALGCSLDRSPLAAGPPGFDAAVPPGEDGGPIPEIDAPRTDDDVGPTTCEPACTDGRVCIDGGCVCPLGVCCPACTGTDTCVGGTCASCGAAGQSCCPTGPGCETGSTCMDDTCYRCGAEGLVCCGSTCDDTLVCNGSGYCEAPPPPGCGAPGERCCAGDTCDAPTEVCADSGILMRTCQTCGVTDGPCCPGTGCTSPGDLCSFGTCRTCGVLGGPCCPTMAACMMGPCRAGFCTGL